MSIMNKGCVYIWRYLRYYRCLFLLSLIGGLGLSCATFPDSIPKDISASELIRFAQEAYSDSDYELAFFYYTTLLDRHADIRSLSLVANYEIGFLHYKLNEYEMARTRFEFLLAEYQRNRSDYPQWVYTLTRKIIEKLPDTSNENE